MLHNNPNTWALTLVLTLMAVPATAGIVEVTYPATGSIVNVGTVVEATLDPSVDPATVQSIDFEYSADTVTWLPIVGPDADGMGDYTALWNARAVSPGIYYLRAKLTDTSNNIIYSSMTVSVQVNAQPIVAAVATGTPTPFKIHYDASSSRDPDGTIVSYSWDFGDGTQGSGPVIDHQFPGPGAWSISLIVADDLGGTSTRNSILALAAQNIFKEKEDVTCGCSKMTIKSDGAIDGPQGFDYGLSNIKQFLPADERTKLGPIPPEGGQLDLSSTDGFDIRFRFEVIADLTANSKPQLCEEGQRVQRTSGPTEQEKDKQGKLSSDARYDSSKSDTDPFNGKMNGSGKCGVNSTNWCDDDYHGGQTARGAGSGNSQPPKRLKLYQGGKIRWLDAPGVHILTKNKGDITTDGFSEFRRFETIVSGPNGVSPCKCTFEIFVTIDKTGKIVNHRIQQVSCTP